MQEINFFVNTYTFKCNISKDLQLQKRSAVTRLSVYIYTLLPQEQPCGNHKSNQNKEQLYIQASQFSPLNIINPYPLSAPLPLVPLESSHRGNRVTTNTAF